jgi:hypothetical protein
VSSARGAGLSSVWFRNDPATCRNLFSGGSAHYHWATLTVFWRVPSLRGPSTVILAFRVFPLAWAALCAVRPGCGRRNYDVPYWRAPAFAKGRKDSSSIIPLT